MIKSNHSISYDIIKNAIYEAIPSAIIEQIIVFGSYARGDNTTDSDVDICVIVNIALTRDEVRNYRKEICNAFIKQHRLPIDLLIKSSDYYNRYKSVACSIERAIATEGIRL